MNKTEVNRLLRKKGWTGEETGRAIVLDLINGYTGNTKLLFPADLLKEKMQAFSKSRGDMETYTRYYKLTSWLMQYQAVANANLQRYQGAMNLFIGIHGAAENAEMEYHYREQLPRILTQKQYDDIKARRIEEWLDPSGDGSDPTYDTGLGLIVHLSRYYAKQLEEHPKQANPLKAIRKLYLEQQVENPAYIAGYNMAAGKGYYVLPDGTRSDKVTEEEWEERLRDLSPSYRERAEEMDSGLFAAPGSKSFKRLISEARAAHMGEDFPKEKGIAEWVCYEDAQDGLTKWDLVKADADGEAPFFPYIVLSGEDEETTGDAKAFKEEFPELVEALLKAAGKALGFKPSSLPVDKWADTRFTWRKLYEAGFPGFREWVESDTIIFEDDTLAWQNGIAIIKPRSGDCEFIDEKGYYIEPERNIPHYGLDIYLPEDPKSGDNINAAEHTRKTLEESLRFIIGYDTAMDLLADATGIKDISVFKVDSKVSLARTDALNSLFDLLYRKIEAISYADRDLKQAKLQVLRDVFYPLKTEELMPSEKAKARAAEMLRGLEAFADERTGTTPGWDFLEALITPEEGAEK